MKGTVLDLSHSSTIEKGCLKTLAAHDVFPPWRRARLVEEGLEVPEEDPDGRSTAVVDRLSGSK
jgi:hypothetical protein